MIVRANLPLSRQQIINQDDVEAEAFFWEKLWLPFAGVTFLYLVNSNCSPLVIGNVFHFLSSFYLSQTFPLTSTKFNFCVNCQCLRFCSLTFSFSFGEKCLWRSSEQSPGWKCDFLFPLSTLRWNVFNLSTATNSFRVFLFFFVNRFGWD